MHGCPHARHQSALPRLHRRHSQRRSTRCRAAGAGCTKSNSTVIACNLSRYQRDHGLHAERQRLDQTLKKIADDAWHINAGSAIIDGEVVVPAADGTTDFSVLQNELNGHSTKIVMRLRPALPERL
jgi:hypothetical protein